MYHMDLCESCSWGQPAGCLAWQKLECCTIHVNFSTESFHTDCLVGLVVRHPPREWKIPGLNPACTGIFWGLSHTSDSKTGTPVATLPGAWRYRVSAGTGPGVSMLWLDEVESLICNSYLSVAARRLVWADPSLRYTSMLLDVKQPANKQSSHASHTSRHYSLQPFYTTFSDTDLG